MPQTRELIDAMTTRPELSSDMLVAAVDTLQNCEEAVAAGCDYAL